MHLIMFKRYSLSKELKEQDLKRYQFLKKRHHFYFFKTKPIAILTKYERWRRMSKPMSLFRKDHMHWDKIKLVIIYFKTYQEKISSWKIQKTIEKYKLYPNPVRNQRI